MTLKYLCYSAAHSPLMVLLLFLTALPTFAQQDSLQSLVKKFDNHSTQNFQEKIFIHTDRTFYLTGETIWFSVFLVDGYVHKPCDLSKVAYLEVIDKDKVSLLKTKVSMEKGHGNGSLFLPSSLASGKFIVRAYTRWMRNFSSDLYFQQPITVVNPFVRLNHQSSDKPSYDVQFFPEGGNMVSGLPNTVAFRVVDKNGKGIAFKGAILNNKNDTVLKFSPLKFGLGRFSFVPEKNQQYTSVITDLQQHKILTPLPALRDEGYTIHVTDTSELINIHVRSKFREVQAEDQKIYVFIQCRQARVAAMTQPLINGATNFRIEKKILGDGVNHITVFNGALNPVCERMYFKRPHHNLQLEVKPDRENYSIREKIELDVTAIASDQHLTKSTLSVSVYRVDSLEQEDPLSILNYLWLTSELKGTIESPEYYLKENADQIAVDNLMLTHGWSRFKWPDILSNQKDRKQFVAEYGGHLLTGTVFGSDGSRAPGVNTYFSVVGKKARLSLSQSDAQGNVTYEVRDFLGKHKVVAQTNPEVDSTFRIELNETYADAPQEIIVPDFSLSKEATRNLIQRSQAMQLQHAFEKENQKIKPIDGDSLPFYGRSPESYALDDFTRFPTMEEVVREYIRGVSVRKKKDKFQLWILDRANNVHFNGSSLVMLDGVPIFNVNHIMAYDPRKIQKMDVIPKKYFFGHLTFDGVISCTTYKGNLLDFNSDIFPIQTIEGLQFNREFFSPLYETNSKKESRIPDARHLLYWSPSVKTDSSGKNHVTFYSSDVPGRYRIVVQGLSDDGEPGFKVTEFQVMSK